MFNNFQKHLTLFNIKKLDDVTLFLKEVLSFATVYFVEVLAKYGCFQK